MLLLIEGRQRSNYFCRSWQKLYFEPRVVQYIKLVGTSNTVNKVSRCYSSSRVGSAATTSAAPGRSCTSSPESCSTSSWSAPATPSTRSVDATPHRGSAAQQLLLPLLAEAVLRASSRAVHQAGRHQQHRQQGQ
ncbi:hypothetical protein O0L34_g6760 [Tuta absoluta]|nr:hypothetical protein O0L34_g6760 [Tuta absoluta]